MTPSPKRSEKAPVKFSIATGNEKKDGEGKYPLVFHNITAWHIPEAIDIKKGDFVKVTGRLNYTKWTDKNGVERNGVEIVATSITLDPKPEDGPKPITPNLHGVAITDQDIPF